MPLLRGIAVFIFLLGCGETGASKGCVQLDSYSFDKVTSKFEVSLIKFDSVYPYGDKQDAYEAVCEAAVSTPDLLVAEVQVRDYGDRDNEDLSERFDLTKDDFPAVILLRQDSDTPVRFKPFSDSDFNPDNLRRFIRTTSDVNLGLPGCRVELDRLASLFVQGSSPEERKATMKQVEELESTLGDSVKPYLSIMKRVIERGSNFIRDEIARVNNLLNTKLSEDKRKQMRYRINILESFSHRHLEL